LPSGPGPLNPRNWLGDQLIGVLVRLGYPEDALVAEVRRHQTEIDAELERLAQTDEYQRLKAAWDEHDAQLNAMRTELGIADAEKVGYDILDELTDVANEMAEVAEQGDINALAGWCVLRFALEEIGPCLVTLKAVAPFVTFQPITRVSKELFAAVAAADDCKDDIPWWRDRSLGIATARSVQ
jgi:hypothetical protein